MTLPDFSRAQASAAPFPHFRAVAALPTPAAADGLRWLQEEADWNLRIEDFYEQHEIDLTGSTEPGIAALASPDFVEAVRTALAELLPTDGALELVGVAAHRLTAGQTIRIHNDYIDAQETHRLLIQLNDGWTTEQGGLLMLFSDSKPEALADVVLPSHASAFGFRMSEGSHHAVSTVRWGSRYTVVYTFRQAA